MLGVTDIWTYVLGTVAIVLLPGPNSLYVLSTAASRGVRQGYRAAFGVFAGDSVLMFASAAGVASLLRTYPPVFLVIKYAGAAYLGYLGVRMVASAVSRWRSRGVPAETVADTEPDTTNPFRKAFTISLMNPKAILFFVSFFIQFVDPGYAYPAVTFLLLATIAQLFSAAYLSVLIFSGNRLAQAFRRRRRLAAAGSTTIGALFLGFGLKLATASLN
ncbi:leucine efflux protein LeuE [Catellatospora sp. KI3]|uniref:leucine efflux protein LeuE n=1 Tax=Catellatospora sp. KI3 TaxID=3041620 RepID=UPI002482360A|nr:leucine efflux protein LeuE [Catellatospora sp. KI3]MDI1459387.1 leucine efflux protein LeuE [Catellatospora sp. KI3]